MIEAVDKKEAVDRVKAVTAPNTKLRLLKSCGFFEFETSRKPEHRYGRDITFITLDVYGVNA